METHTFVQKHRLQFKYKYFHIKKCSMYHMIREELALLIL